MPPHTDQTPFVTGDFGSYMIVYSEGHNLSVVTHIWGLLGEEAMTALVYRDYAMGNIKRC